MGSYAKFKGTDSEYSVLHAWVRKNKGEKKNCVQCGHDGSASRLEWANVSGQYLKDLDDFECLCGMCHRAKDRIAKSHCPRGHEYSNDNLYVNPRGHKMCRICRRLHHLKKRPLKEKKLSMAEVFEMRNLSGKIKRDKLGRFL